MAAEWYPTIYNGCIQVGIARDGGSRVAWVRVEGDTRSRTNANLSPVRKPNGKQDLSRIEDFKLHPELFAYARTRVDGCETLSGDGTEPSELKHKMVRFVRTAVLNGDLKVVTYSTKQLEGLHGHDGELFNKAGAKLITNKSGKQIMALKDQTRNMISTKALDRTDTLNEAQRARLAEIDGEHEARMVQMRQENS